MSAIVSVFRGRRPAYKPQDKDTAAVIVAFCFDVCVCHKEDGENDSDDIPTRENQAKMEIHCYQTE